MEVHYSICTSHSDNELEKIIHWWLEHYISFGDSHYIDTPDWKIREIYWNKILNRVIEEVNIEMDDEEIERFCNMVSDL